MTARSSKDLDEATLKAARMVPYEQIMTQRLEYFRSRPRPLRERLNQLWRDIWEHASRWRGIALAGAVLMLAQMVCIELPDLEDLFSDDVWSWHEPHYLKFIHEPSRYFAYASLFVFTFWIVMLAVTALRRAQQSGGGRRHASLLAFMLVCIEWIVMVGYFFAARI
jgi:hypothetical protein